jgi:uncharacterized membrane protein YhfC
MPTFFGLLNALLMIALPLALIFFLVRRFHLAWRIIIVGALTFIVSQIIHIPLLFGLTFLFVQVPIIPKDLALPFNAIVLGLMAGLCEEIARYIALRWALPTARTWPQALGFGAGHGGIEAIIFGVVAALTTLQFTVLHNTDPSQWGVPAAQLPLVQQQVTAFWSSPWYLILLGALERVFALCIHLSATVLVLQVFTRKNLGWLLAAIAWHAVVDGLTVYIQGVSNPYWTELWVAASALISLGLVFALRDSARDSDRDSDRDSAHTNDSAPAPQVENAAS